jgi:hypothetical protein
MITRTILDNPTSAVLAAAVEENLFAVRINRYLWRRK